MKKRNEYDIEDGFYGKKEGEIQFFDEKKVLCQVKEEGGFGSTRPL